MILEFISAKGEIMPLTGNQYFKLSNVDGITTASVNIASSTTPSLDGDIVNNTQVTPRSIVLDLAIEREVEKAKRYILKYVKPKMTASLRMTQNERTTQISGVVEAIEMPRFTNLATMQITLHCSQPFWEDIEYSSQDIAEVIDLFYFTDNEESEIEDDEDNMLYFPEEGIPFGEYDANRTKVLTNDGDVEIGIEIHIVALGTVTNPVIGNYEGEYIGVDITMQAGQEIIITTGKGEKKIELDGENKISKIREGSTWLQLRVGENEFTIDSDDEETGNMYFTVVYRQRYV